MDDLPLAGPRSQALLAASCDALLGAPCNALLAAACNALSGPPSLQGWLTGALGLESAPLLGCGGSEAAAAAALNAGRAGRVPEEGGSGRGSQPASGQPMAKSQSRTPTHVRRSSRYRVYAPSINMHGLLRSFSLLLDSG